MELNKSKWKKVKFGDLVTNKKTTVDARNCGLDRYIAGDHMNSEDLHLRRFGVIGDDYLGPAFHRKFEKGDILYGSRRTYLKKVAVADFDGITANTTFVLKGNEKMIMTGLIPFLMLSDKFTEHSVMHSKGSVNPYINYKDIAQYEFFLPPKDQQVKLTKLLWASNEVVEKYLQVYHELLSFSKLGIEKYNASNFKKSKLNNVLRQRKTISTFPHKLERYIGLEHVESGSYSCSNYASSSTAESNCFCFNEGDLMYSKLRPYLDKAFIAEFSGVCTTELMIFEVTNADKEYILHLLHSPSFISFVNSKSFGTKMPRVSNDIVSSYEAYLPNLEEQVIIRNELNKIKANLKNTEGSILKAKEIQKQLINQIFSE